MGPLDFTEPLTGTPDLGVKIKKIPGVIKGRFYVTTPLSDSWEAFTPIASYMLELL